MREQKRGSIALAALALTGAVALGVAALPEAVETLWQAGVKLTVDGQALKLEHEALLVDGVTYVPLRECAENRGYQVVWNEKARQIEVDTRHRKVSDAEKVDEQGVIPDEATALAVGKAILEGALGRSVEYKDGGREFYLTAHYYENTNVWWVDQLGKYEGHIYYGTNALCLGVILDKATGEVLHIGLNPLPEKSTPAGRWEDGALIWPLGVQEDGTLILPESHDIPEGFIPLEDIMDMEAPLYYTFFPHGVIRIMDRNTDACVAEFPEDDPTCVFKDGPVFYIDPQVLRDMGYQVD